MSATVNNRSKPGKICLGPHAMCHFGPNINDDINYNICVDGNDELQRFEQHGICTVGKKKVDDKPNLIERKEFASLNAPIG